jgi:hypothetical protein
MNWFDRVILGRKPGKPRRKLKLDRWFMVFMALLLWTLSTILFRYAFDLPYNLANYQLWLRMLAIIIAIFGWIWLFKIYVASVRAKSKVTMTCLECHGEFEIPNGSNGMVAIFCPYCGTKGIAKKGEK